MDRNVVPLIRPTGKRRPKPRDIRLGEMLPTIQAALNRLAPDWFDDARIVELGPFTLSEYRNRVVIPGTAPVTIIDVSYRGPVPGKVMSLNLMSDNSGDYLCGKVTVVSWKRGAWEDDLLARCYRTLGEKGGEAFAGALQQGQFLN